MRLQKYLSECGVSSRRGAEKLISDGKVKINGKTVTTLGVKIVPGKDKVSVSGKLVRPAEKGIILLNKPGKVVSTKKDPEGRKTVMHFLSPKDRKSYFPVGRLDYETTGLVILTNDGELAQILTHPSYEIPRTYRVHVKGRIPDKILERVESGVKLEDGPIKVEVQSVEDADRVTILTISLHVGRNRIVRRLFEKVGYPVQKLERLSHGPFKLGKIKRGEIQRLEASTYERVRKKILGFG